MPPNLKKIKKGKPSYDIQHDPSASKLVPIGEEA
jgi:hypothetical protein